MTLRVDWASHDAAKFATSRWHYSRSMPGAKIVKVGAWENDAFIGVVLFSLGATPEIGSLYGLTQQHVCELTRVALAPGHRTPVSRILAIAIRMLRRQSPGLRLIVSFADTAQGHHGGIYQAGGWIYLGEALTHSIRLHGAAVHPRSLGSRYGTGGQSIPWLRANVDPTAERITTPAKHRYVMPLDDAMRAQIAPRALPYPKRAKAAGATVPPSPGRFDTDPRAPIPAAA